MNFEAVVLGDLAEIFPDAKIGKVGGNYVAQDIEWSKRNRYVEWFGTDDAATVHFIGADTKREYRLYFVFTSLNRIVYAGYEDGGDERDVVITDVFEHSPVKDNFIKINKLIDTFKAIFPDTTERQVSDAITKQGQYKSEGNTLTELQQQLSEQQKETIPNVEAKKADIPLGKVGKDRKSVV